MNAIHSPGVDTAGALSFMVAWADTAFSKTDIALVTPARITWRTFTDVLAERREGVKDGPNFIGATFGAISQAQYRRVKDNVVTRTAIAMDFETNKETGEISPDLAETAARITRQGWAAAIYTSHNHTKAAPRYRIVIPLSEEIEPTLPAVDVVAGVLGLAGVLDTSKIGAQSLFYLSSSKPGCLKLHETLVLSGAPIDAAWMRERAGDLLAGREAEQARQNAEAREAAVKRREERISQGFDPDDSIIEKVRGHLDLVGELVSHGHKQVGKKFLYSGSETGVPGVYVLSGSDGVQRAFSYHAADPLAAGNLPSWCRTKAVDVVGVVTIIDHGGDQKKALRSLAKRFGIESTRPAAGASEGPQQPGEEAPGKSKAEASAPLLDSWNALQPPPFPIEALPAVLRAFVEDRARVIGADPCGLGWACIGACSTALDGRIRLQMKQRDSWSVPPFIWLARVGAPSTKKSPILDAAWSPSERAQNVDLKVWREEHVRWKALPKKEQAETPVPVCRRRLVSHDATIESLQDILGRQDRGIGILRDELAGWIGSLEKYSGGRGSAADRAFFLQAFNGGGYIADRVSRGTTAIENLGLGISGGIQPDRLRQLGDITSDGLWQRFIPIIVGPASFGSDDSDGQAVSDYTEMVDRLLQVAPETRVQLSQDAHDVREALARRLFDLEQTEAIGAAFSALCGKLLGIWGRLCLVLSQIEPGPVPFIVGREIAEAARTLILGSVLPNAARVYTGMGGGAPTLRQRSRLRGSF